MPLETRLLGRTGVRVSNLCLGAMMFGWRTDPAESYAIVDRAIDAGVNFIDTDRQVPARRGTARRDAVRQRQRDAAQALQRPHLRRDRGPRTDGAGPGCHAVTVRARLGDGAARRDESHHRIAHDGATRGPQLEDNLPAADVGITEEDARGIDALIPPGQMVAPFHEADFGPHGFRV